jgi:hypothetical protein
MLSSFDLGSKLQAVGITSPNPNSKDWSCQEMCAHTHPIMNKFVYWPEGTLFQNPFGLGPGGPSITS